MLIEFLAPDVCPSIRLPACLSLRLSVCGKLEIKESVVWKAAALKFKSTDYYNLIEKRPILYLKKKRNIIINSKSIRIIYILLRFL